ncbi:MAG: tRNA (N(6)-L-threonylcarbamoyladenosine(37)-C(2))-methylthiotransferase MtaB [Planctomycetota bacterium]|jgi:threonylcarbamoyladenosine tRNA methylthiotransferase MtaB
MTGKYLITTLGCKVNQYESEHLRGVLESHGLKPACGRQAPDIAIVNTCAVTSSASRKSRQSLRRLARGGATTVVAVGCSASEDADRLRNIPGVSAVFGHDTDVAAELSRLVSHMVATKLGPQVHACDDQAMDDPSSDYPAPLQPEGHSVGPRNQDRVEVDSTHLDRTNDSSEAANTKAGRTATRGNDVWMKPRDAGGTPISTAKVAASITKSIVAVPMPVVNQNTALTSRIDLFDGHQRAFLKVQDGCDAFCTYCIIPRLRPRLRSKPIEIAVDEAKALVDNGHKEIIVTGIFLGAYGRDTAIRKRFDAQVSPLARLIEALAGVKGLRRLRLSSLEPGDVDDDLLGVLADHENCVPHLHLPLQAGSAAILRKMNRQYTRSDFDAMIERTRNKLDRPAISTDIIVGFPGESDRDFQESVTASRNAGFVKIHAFPFSPRNKTAAARWQREFVHNSLVKERMRALATLESELSLAFRQQFVGHAERVLVERDPADWSQFKMDVHHGRSDRYFEIHFESDDVAPGDLLSVRIDRVTAPRTHGTVVRSGSGVSLCVLHDK